MKKDDLRWVRNILQELSVSYEEFMNMTGKCSKKDVEEYLTGKLTEVEKDKLIKSLYK